MLLLSKSFKLLSAPVPETGQNARYDENDGKKDG
jgi:hypothetical protein